MEELFNDHGWRITLDSAELPDGRVKRSARVHRADSAHILAFVNEDTILLLREFRPHYGTYIWMLPSGRIDKEKDLLAGAQRELQEETGFTADHLEHIWTTRQSEAVNFANHILIARGLASGPLPQDEDELIEVHEVQLEEALKRVLDSEHVHTASAYALLRYLRDRQQ